MEDENRKARRVARREFNDQVRRGGGCWSGRKLLLNNIMLIR